MVLIITGGLILAVMNCVLVYYVQQLWRGARLQAMQSDKLVGELRTLLSISGDRVSGLAVAYGIVSDKVTQALEQLRDAAIEVDRNHAWSMEMAQRVEMLTKRIGDEIARAEIKCSAAITQSVEQLSEAIQLSEERLQRNIDATEKRIGEVEDEFKKTNRLKSSENRPRSTFGMQSSAASEGAVKNLSNEVLAELGVRR